VAGYLLGGALLGVLPVRGAIAAAGLGGLAATAAFALPVLRDTARERDTARRTGSGPADQSRPAHRTRASGRASGR
jgi:hypothetical protein